MDWDAALLARVRSFRACVQVDLAARVPDGEAESLLAARFVRLALETMFVKVEPTDVEVSTSDGDFRRDLEARWRPAELTGEVVGGPLNGQTFTLPEALDPLFVPEPAAAAWAPEVFAPSRSVALRLSGWSEGRRTLLYLWPAPR